MQMQQGMYAVGRSEADLAVRQLLQKVYAWMSVGLMLTGVTAYLVASSPALYGLFLGTPLFWACLATELVMVFAFSAVVRRVSLPVVLDTGDGQAETSLNVVPGARISVRSIRLRGPSGRTLATAGALVERQAASVSTTTTTSLPPTPDQCPAALTACQASLSTSQQDLADCNEELDICEELE